MECKHRECPECQSKNFSIELHGTIINWYENGKFICKIFDFPLEVFECSDCGYKED